MPQNPHAQFDETVLELIEHSPVGAVPNTPTYQDALARLHASHQVYADADHRDGHVTARSLARMPSFHANNLEALLAGSISGSALESNASIFDRYVQSLSPERRVKAEGCRALVAGRAAHHRKHGGVAAQDPVHTLFLVPGAGPHVGVPGNYLYGSLFQAGADFSTSAWTLQIHDSDDGGAQYQAPTLADAWAKLQELLASAPFELSELEVLGFTLT